MASAESVAAEFRQRFGVAPAVVASAPGRVNLIGEHTDYNEGLVLPMAIGRRAWVALAPRASGEARIHSVQLGELKAGDTSWGAIALGVLREFAALEEPRGAEAASPTCLLRLPGEIHVDLLIDSDVPAGSGLSSSAAVEMALARALGDAAGRRWVPFEMARLGQRVEHAHAGVRSGLMDQAVCAAARAGTAMLLDCRSLDARFVALPADAAVVVMDTGVRRTLDATAYNARRAACEDAVASLRRSHPSVRALRDVSEAMLAGSARALSPEALRRARHVVSENARVSAFADALERGDLSAGGGLLDASHASLRDDYEVSSAQLDIVCELARAHPACLGARLTGAGFGGCAIALVRAGDAEAFIADVQPRYEATSYKRAAFFRATPSAGARIDARTGTPEGPAAG